MSSDAPSFAEGSGFASAANGSNAGKKAVHVKWAGKTIALGTFPAAEADEKCARAKALTRAWRSTMRPKPTRDWVMIELERLGVRVVSGRLGRKAGEEGDDDIMPPTSNSKKGSVSGNPMSSLGMSPPIERSGSMGWGNEDLNSLMNRRTSMGLSMMNDGRRGSLGSLGPVVGLDSVDPTLAHRQLGGGFDVEAQRRASSLGLGSLTGGGLGMGLSVNPNQHYEMLKLHHMNLLNEIQETTLMMNLYQQQQLQQQQQQLQQQATVEGLVGGDPQLSMMHQQNGMDPLFGAGKLMQHQRGSLGLGGGGNFGNPQMQLMQHQMLQQNVGQLSGMQHPNSMGTLPSASMNASLVGKDSGLPESSGKKKSGSESKKKKAKDSRIKDEPKEEKEDIDDDDDEDDDDEDEDDDDDDDNEADEEEDHRKAV